MSTTYSNHSNHNKYEGPIHNGPRDDSFRVLITNILKRGKLSQENIDALLTEENLNEYNKVFTSKHVDSDNNYEIYEQLGDVSVNKFFVWYVYKRFPCLNYTDGVKIVARLKIKYTAKQTFFTIANNLGFWNFITAHDSERDHRQKALLEDTLEAFVGCTEQLLDRTYRCGVGYAIVYDILSSIFDSIPISLTYEELVDAKTRLKELVDHWYEEIGNIKYVEEKHDKIITSKVIREYDFTTVNVWDNELSMMVPKRGPHRRSDVIGYGSASIKPDAQQKAAEYALQTLANLNFVKEVPEIYRKIQK